MSDRPSRTPTCSPSGEPPGRPSGSARTAAFDAEIAARFLPTYEARRRRPLAAWEDDARERARAHHRARPVSAQHVPRQCARLRGRCARARASPSARSRAASTRQSRAASGLFFYLPFEHSESLADQERCVALIRAHRRCRLLEMGGAARRRHPPLRAFPHRNSALGRATTREEQAFLDAGGFAG